MMWKLKACWRLGLHDGQELDGAEEVVSRCSPDGGSSVQNNPAIRADLTHRFHQNSLKSCRSIRRPNGSISQPSCMTNHPIVITAQPVNSFRIERLSTRRIVAVSRKPKCLYVSQVRRLLTGSDVAARIRNRNAVEKSCTTNMSQPGVATENV